jgi:hypothetical protein
MFLWYGRPRPYNSHVTDSDQEKRSYSKGEIAFLSLHNLLLGIPVL